MLSLFKRTKQNAAIAQSVYGAIVAQARQTGFYARLGVPDSLEGRFDMVVLHLILALDRLGRAGDAGKALAQAVFDQFTTDMDRAMRETGVGDLSVPRKMKTVAKSFYGRWQAYGPALAAGDRGELAGAIGRNVWPGAEIGPDASRLADYALALRDALDREEDASLLSGRISYPDVDLDSEAAAE